MIIDTKTLPATNLQGLQKFVSHDHRLRTLCRVYRSITKLRSVIIPYDQLRYENQP